MNKDAYIQETLDRLRACLGPMSFDVVDHWDADLLAVGVARPGDHSTLVYFTTVTTNDDAEGLYHAQLEGPPDADSDLPYKQLRAYSGLDFEQLVELIREHLGIRKQL